MPPLARVPIDRLRGWIATRVQSRVGGIILVVMRDPRMYDGDTTFGSILAAALSKNPVVFPPPRLLGYNGKFQVGLIHYSEEFIEGYTLDDFGTDKCVHPDVKFTEV